MDSDCVYLFIYLFIIFFSFSDGMDYNSGNSNLTIVFSPGSSDTDQVSISIVNDNIFEMLNETFVVIMDSDDPDVSVPGIALVTVVVMDDDSELQSFGQLQAVSSEGYRGLTGVPLIISLCAN